MQIRLAVVLYSIQVLLRKDLLYIMCVLICRLLVFFMLVCQCIL